MLRGVIHRESNLNPNQNQNEIETEMESKPKLGLNRDNRKVVFILQIFGLIIIVKKLTQKSGSANILKIRCFRV